jgi:hypothetical protein
LVNRISLFFLNDLTFVQPLPLSRKPDAGMRKGLRGREWGGINSKGRRTRGDWDGGLLASWPWERKEYLGFLTVLPSFVSMSRSNSASSFHGSHHV